jgi:hypothetical protein
MLATGIAGVTAAALALVGGLASLSQPVTDPLALFELPDTERDQQWAERLLSAGVADVTLGPRVVDLDDGTLAIVFRSAAVADGRSTEWDPYCVLVSDPAMEGPAWTTGGACVLPELFEQGGLVATLAPSERGGGLDAVAWGPIGAPRLERNVPYTEGGYLGGTTVLDRMIYPSEPLDFVDNPERLLLGPSTLLAGEADDGDTSFVIASTYLLASEVEGAEPALCVHIGANDGSSATRCATLSEVRRSGIDLPITASGRSWLVTIDPDGPNRSDALTLVD